MGSSKRDIYSLDKLRMEIKTLKEKISIIKAKSNTCDFDLGNGFGKFGKKNSPVSSLNHKILYNHAPDPNFEIVKFQGIALNQKSIKKKSNQNPKSSKSTKVLLNLNKNSGSLLKSSISCSQKLVNTESTLESQRDSNKDKIAPLKSILKQSNTFTSLDFPQESYENSHLFAEISALKNENRKILSKITKLTSSIGSRKQSSKIIGKGGGNSKKDKKFIKAKSPRSNCRSIISTSRSESELVSSKCRKSTK